MENTEKEKCNLSLIFAEIFKDEINANEEQDLYQGVKKVIKKYMNHGEGLAAINEFVSVISGGASLDELIQVSLDEAENPTPISDILVDDSCRYH
ncbi:MAG: hypothetical protein N2645_03210 [Clostridia bacterium]|nr:hypothetical protein [Clostridia bacterium]